MKHHSNYLCALKTSSSAVRLLEGDDIFFPPSQDQICWRADAGIQCHAPFSFLCSALARKHFLQDEHSLTHCLQALQRRKDER